MDRTVAVLLLRRIRSPCVVARIVRCLKRPDRSALHRDLLRFHAGCRKVVYYRVACPDCGTANGLGWAHASPTILSYIELACQQTTDCWTCWIRNTFCDRERLDEEFLDGRRVAYCNYRRTGHTNATYVYDVDDRDTVDVELHRRIQQSREHGLVVNGVRYVDVRYYISGCAGRPRAT